MWETILIGLGASLAITWLLLLVGVLIARRKNPTATAGLATLVPRTLQLLGSLARARELPLGLRLRLAAAIAYNVQPFNLIPDWIPVIGFADNVAVICWALRSVIRRAGPEIVARHWRGAPEALSQLYAGLRLPPAAASEPGERASPAPAQKEAFG